MVQKGLTSVASPKGIQPPKAQRTICNSGNSTCWKMATCPPSSTGSKQLVWKRMGKEHKSGSSLVCCRAQLTAFLSSYLSSEEPSVMLGQTAMGDCNGQLQWATAMGEFTATAGWKDRAEKLLYGTYCCVTEEDIIRGELPCSWELTLLE